MCVIHLSTQISGGAGAFVQAIHVTMMELGISSLLYTRESNGLKNTKIIKPLTRVSSLLNARKLYLLEKVGFIDNKYAAFGIEKSPVNIDDLRLALGSKKPTAFIFYWVSYFINFKHMLELRKEYPDVPFVFVCLDEALLTGGCHYTWGCGGYENECSDCPSSVLSYRKNKIKQEFSQRQALIHEINPVVLYPTTNLQQMGKRSALLKKLRSAVIPLGAVSEIEKSNNINCSVKKNKLTVLVRSSSEFRKGCDLFAEAITRLSVLIPDLRSKIEVISIGDTTLLDAKIDEYVNHNYLGFVPRSELMEIYKKIDALIVTSREDAGPIMINECVALEKFVITTRVGVAEDLVKDKENGLILHEFSSTAIVEALTYFLDSESACERQSLSAYTSNIDSSVLTFEGYIQTMMDVIQVVPVNDR